MKGSRAGGSTRLRLEATRVVEHPLVPCGPSSPTLSGAAQNSATAGVQDEPDRDLTTCGLMLYCRCGDWVWQRVGLYAGDHEGP